MSDKLPNGIVMVDLQPTAVPDFSDKPFMVKILYTLEQYMFERMDSYLINSIKNHVQGILFGADVNWETIVLESRTKRDIIRPNKIIFDCFYFVKEPTVLGYSLIVNGESVYYDETNNVLKYVKYMEEDDNISE